MKKTIQTKRTKPKSSGFRALYAKTGSQRKMKAATATMDSHADLESDIPNVGMGRALLVILLLHVVAIAAIYVHMTFFGNKSEPVTEQALPTLAVNKVEEIEVLPPLVQTPAPAPAPVVSQSVAPSTGSTHSQRYIVLTGDSYSRIAEVRNVDEVSLRALNNDRPLRAGVVLDLPAELSSRPVAVAESLDDPNPQTLAVKVKPQRVYPRAILVDEDPVVSNMPSAQDSGKTYTVQSGDTIWRICKRYSVSRENLMYLNGITDANKLSVGVKLRIPTQ